VAVGVERKEPVTRVTQFASREASVSVGVEQRKEDVLVLAGDGSNSAELRGALSAAVGRQLFEIDFAVAVGVDFVENASDVGGNVLQFVFFQVPVFVFVERSKLLFGRRLARVNRRAVVENDLQAVIAEDQDKAARRVRNDPVGRPQVARQT